MSRLVEELLLGSVPQPSPLTGATKVIIYGAGNAGHAVYRCLQHRGMAVPCFLDRKAIIRANWEGVPVLRPDDEAIPLAARDQTPVVIAVFNRESDPRGIVEKLHSLGYPKVVTLVETYDYFLPEMRNCYWLASRASYGNWTSAVNAATDIWGGESSRELYAAVVKYRLSGNHAALPDPKPEHQYLPDDIPPWRTPVRLVDCGAYPGDTPGLFLKKRLPVEAVAMFDPDPDNFAALQNVTRRDFPPEIDVALWPCAVGSKTECRRFSAGCGESSRFDSGGGSPVQCAALDEVIPRFRPSLLKLDVEGAEMDALEGARRIIHDNLPALAVCLYHRPEHLWQIPLAVKRLNRGYDLYLRLHGFNGLELVLYAVHSRARV